MSSNGRRGTITWVMGFLALLTIFNVFNALIQLNLNGSASTAYFTVLGTNLGSLNVEAYFWTSLIMSFLLLGALSYSIYRGLPADPKFLHRIAKVEESLAQNSNMLENTQIGFFTKLEENEKANDEFFRKISLNLDGMKNEASENLDKLEKSLQNMEEESRKNSDLVKKQAADLANLKMKIGKLGKETGQKAKLTSKTKLEKVKTISPRLATKLNQIKTTNVSELLAADPVSIAAKASEMVETIANAQAMAQLLMVPGIDEKHSELLVKYGITSRKELANQDPVQLYRGVVGIAKTYVEQGKLPARKVPTVEDVSSWIRQAQL